MTWLYYLLESNFYLVVFYGFYLIFLQKETFYGLNRAYLISSSLFSFLIPFLQVGSLNKLIYGDRMENLVNINQNVDQNRDLSNIVLEHITTILYLVIVAFLAIRVLLSLYKILSLALSAKKQRLDSVIYVELNGSVSAFSFFNLLFINPSSTGKSTILKHEMVHIKQKHSLDILFFELLRIINWFNPIVWLMQKDIKLVHEYIADDQTTNADVEKHDYAMFLIQNSFGVTPNYLTNQIFNQSILKRRINMLNKRKSSGRARLRILLALPIAGGMLMASTVAFSKDYAMIDLYPEKYSVASLHDQQTKPKNQLAAQAQTLAVEPPQQTLITNATPRKNAKTGKKETIKSPPLEKKDQVKFPPPIVVKDGQIPPPPPPGHKPGLKSSSKKRGVVKFPPPIVKPDNQELPPPPPIEPPSPRPSKKAKAVKENENKNSNTNGVLRQVEIIPATKPVKENK